MQSQCCVSLLVELNASLLENFTYSDDNLVETMFRFLENTSFIGLTVRASTKYIPYWVTLIQSQYREKFLWRQHLLLKTV